VTRARAAAVPVLIATFCVAPPINAHAAPVPTTSCMVFPADNIWNTDISTLPVNANSATWLASTMPASGNLHPDFGGATYGIPFNVVDNSHATANYTFQYASESDAGPYPAGGDLLVEQGSDAHVLTVNKDTCKLYETFATDPVAHTAGSGAIFDLGSDQLRPAGWTSADAAGLPIFPGLVRLDEVKAGFIGHAIRFTVHNTDNTYLWPARHQAGIANSNLPPMGARFRLKAGYDISTFGTEAQVVLTAFKHYGLIVADNGSDWFFQGTEDAGWDSTIISDLKKVPASQFEAIDESSLMVSADSAATTPTSPPATPAAAAAIAGEASATLYWTAPATGVVTGYTIVASPGGKTATALGSTRSATVTGLTDGTAYTFTITATNSVGTSPPSAASNVVIPGRGPYTALPPMRILDTRNGIGAPIAPVAAGGTLNVQITGQGGVPATGVSAVVLNVTATNTTAASYLTVWPAGLPRPLASNLNWTAGATVPNLVEVALGVNGQVSVFNALGNADVIFDVAGYVTAPIITPPTAGLYTPSVPNRLLDTRNGTGATMAPVGQSQAISVQVAGMSTIPSAGAAAVVLNVTATNPTDASFLTVYPTGTARPVASNLNFVAAQTVPNRVVVKLGAGGAVSFYNAFGSVDVVADVAGWFGDGTTATTGSMFVGVTPGRILDTRAASAIGPGATAVLMVAGQGGVPLMSGAVSPTAVVLNVTVTNPTAASFLAIWPDGSPRPTASDLNYLPALTVPNLVVVRLGPSAAIDIYNAFGTADVVVDVVGWYG
jgi:Fibronectin type III domain